MRSAGRARWASYESLLSLGRRHRDNHDRKNTEEKIGKANPHWRPVDVHGSTYFQQELRARPQVKRLKAAGAPDRPGKVAEGRSAVSDAHDFDELACPEIAEWCALGEILLGFDPPPQLVGHLADNRDVSGKPWLRSAISRTHAGDANHGDDVESHRRVFLLRRVFAIEDVRGAVIPVAFHVST